MSIELHKQCLKNMQAHLDSKEQELIRMKNSFSELNYNYEIYRKQIVKAKALKKDSFDRERFSVNK